MKRFRCARFLIALLAASLLPGCGGGGDDGGDRYVSITQFESGSAGFFITGVGGTMRIRSYGVGSNSDVVSGGAPKGDIPLPGNVFNVDIERGDQGYNIPEEWLDVGAVADQTKMLTGELIISEMRVASIIGMVYQMEEGNHRAYLRVLYTPDMSASTYTQAMANFFGYVSVTDVSSSSTGNAGSMVWVDESNQRVVLPAAQGTSIHVWFNFDSGTCLIQLYATVHYELVDPDTGNTISSGVTPDALISNRDSYFYKTVN